LCSSASSLAPSAQLQSITRKAVCKRMRHGGIEQLYMAFVRDTGAVEVQSVPQPKGADDPRVAALLAEYADVSPDTMPVGVPPNRGVEHPIVLKPGAQPPPPRSLHHQSPKDLAAIRAHLDAGLAAGTIQKSVSPFGAMMFVVPKKDGSPRIVVDYRPLNEISVKNAYPLSLIDELFDRVAGAKYVTSSDLHEGFSPIAPPQGSPGKSRFPPARQPTPGHPHPRRAPPVMAEDGVGALDGGYHPRGAGVHYGAR